MTLGDDFKGNRMLNYAKGTRVGVVANISSD